MTAPLYVMDERTSGSGVREVRPREMPARRGAACHVVNEGCKAPPATFDVTRAECFACGNPVCTNPACSRRATWHRYGRRRVCACCLEEESKP